MQADTSDLMFERIPPGRESLRIAVVTETYPPEVNGVSLTLARLVGHLHERNHDIQLFRPRQGGDDAPDKELRFSEVLMRGMPVPKYPSLRMGLPSKRALLKVWSHHRPDIVHIATEGPLGWSALRAAKVLKLPVTSDFRTNFDTYSLHYGLGWLQSPVAAYLKKFHNRTDCTMVPTNALRHELAGKGYQRLEVVMRGVDTTLFSPKRRNEALRVSWGASDSDCVLLCVGRLAPEKGLGLLARAFDELRKTMGHVKLVLVGDGPMRAELARLCPTAIFAGQRRGEDLAAHYASADAFIFPSLSETFGNVVPEAMASGLPVLAFDHAAAAELIVDGVNGMKVPPGHDLQFIQTAAVLAQDAGLRARLAQRSLETALTMDWTSVAARFESILLRVLRNASLTSDDTLRDTAVAR